MSIMPNFQTHCAISLKRTNFDFAELHYWIDNSPNGELLGSDHRIERHAYKKDDMECIRSYWDEKKGVGWGDKAVIEWLFHIALDNLSTAFKFSKSHYGENTYNYMQFGLESSGYIHAAFNRRPDSELRYEFESI